jgi:thioredoxin 1
MSAKSVNAQELENYHGKEGLVVVDFYAPWCPACQRLEPIMDEVAIESQEARVLKVNVDEHRDLAAKYSIASLPTVIMFKGGEKVDQFIGLQPKEEIHKYITKNA